MSESEKLRKIFIGGLNWNTTEEGLKDYFSQWGTIVDCVIMKKEGRSRGFGFVTYSTSQSVDEVLKIKGHVLDDREIEPKRSVPREESNHPSALSKTRKIFVGGLASTTTEEDIKDYFNGLCKKDDMGEVIDVDLKRDRENPSRIRGFAFVTFNNDDIAEKVCAMKYHEIRMKQCEVKKAEPQSSIRRKEEPESSSRSSRDRDRSDRDYRDRDRDNYRDRESRDYGRDRDRDRDSRGDRGDRRTDDKYGGHHSEKSSRNGSGESSAFGYMNPFAAAAFNPSGFSPAGFGGMGFGSMGFGGFPGAAFGYGGFPAGFSGFGGFGQSAGAAGAGSFDKGSYRGEGRSSSYGSSSEREAASSRSQLPSSFAAAKEGSSLGAAGGPYAGYGQMAAAAALANGMGATPADWGASSYPGVFGAGYGYGDSAAAAAGGASDSAAAKSFPAAGAPEFSMGSYPGMTSAYGPASARPGASALSSTDAKPTSRGYRPY